MKLSPFKVKWMMNLYPPLFFNRIKVKRISSDFLEMDVVIKKSIFNKNLQGTIFGGTIFSSADPFHAIMYWQILAQKGIKVEAWLQSAEIFYSKPGASDLSLAFRLTHEDVTEVLQTLSIDGRVRKWHQIEVLNSDKAVCATVNLQVYLRTFKGKTNANF